MMVTEKELDILRKSLFFINEFEDTVHINTGREFITIHNRNIETIKKIANERNSRYLKDKINEYPTITAAQINDYIKTNRNDVSMLVFILNPTVRFLERFVKTGCFFSQQIRSKIIQIKNTNEEIWEVIENPYSQN